MEKAHRNKQPRRKRRGIFALRFARYAAHLRFTVPYQTLYFRTPQAAGNITLLEPAHNLLSCYTKIF
ncbi:hypothetical protein CCP3SC5AM1_1940002 [Gammaproteobacteria bacterium]